MASAFSANCRPSPEAPVSPATIVPMTVPPTETSLPAAWPADRATVPEVSTIRPSSATWPVANWMSSMPPSKSVLSASVIETAVPVSSRVKASPSVKVAVSPSMSAMTGGASSWIARFWLI